MRGITFIVKPVGDACNLACDYCYFRIQCGNRINTKISSAVLEKFTSEYLSLPHAYRCYPSGDGSFTDVIRGIGLLQKEKMVFALLTVLTKKSLGREEEIFDFFVRSNLWDFDLLPCIANRGMELECAITPQEFAQGAIKLFDLWWQLDNPEVRVRLFESVIRGILGAEQNVCQFAGACASYCTLDYNGDVYPCDNFVGLPDFVFGNIAESSLAKILNCKARRDFIAEVQTLPNECINCHWRSICNAGCTYHRYMRRGVLSDKTYFCSFRKILFQHVRERVSKA